MALDSIGSDLNKLSIKPIGQVGEIQGGTNPIKAPASTSATPKINNDGANVSTGKGRIPASGSIFDSTAKSSAAEKVINQYSSDKKQLQSFLNALENLNLSDGISNESDELMNELLTLGFDISMQGGKIVITDGDGNEIKPEDFGAIKENLKNTLKRAINNSSSVAQTNNVNSASTPKSIGSTPPKMSAAQEEEMLGILKDMGETEKYNQTKVEPLKAEVESLIKEYESKLAQAENQSKKIDSGISQIVSLKGQAEALIEKGKTQPLTSTEKKQLLSITSTIDIKQRELQSYQQGNELLMQQVDQVYAQFSENLSPSEKNTKDAMQAALKAKVSGQSLDVRQNFLASISEDIYKLTANMSDDEIQKLSTDSSARVKLLASTNKLIDKMATSTKLSDFSQQEIDALQSKFNISAVEENGKLEFYYKANTNAQPQKVSKDDLKQMRVDLNNVVTSPSLFTLARASGQISMAYDKKIVEKGKEVSEETTNTQAPAKKTEKVTVSEADKKASKDEKGIKTQSAETRESKEVKQIELAAMDSSIEKRREEEKYHEKQIKHIYDNRRQINKENEVRRTAQVDAEHEQNMKILHNKQ